MHIAREEKEEVEEEEEASLCRAKEQQVAAAGANFSRKDVCVTRAVNIYRGHTVVYEQRAFSRSLRGWMRSSSIKSCSLSLPRCSFRGERDRGRLEKFQPARSNGRNFSRDPSPPPPLSPCSLLAESHLYRGGSFRAESAQRNKLRRSRVDVNYTLFPFGSARGRATKIGESAIAVAFCAGMCVCVCVFLNNSIQQTRSPRDRIRRQLLQCRHVE